MVRAGENSLFRFHTAGKPPDTNFFETQRQGFGTSCVNPKTPISPAFPDCAFTGNLYLNTKETNSTYGLPHSLPPYHQPVFPSLKPKAFENGSFQSKYLVFDCSNNGTRLLFGPSIQTPIKQCWNFNPNMHELGIHPKLDLNIPVFEDEKHHVVEEQSEMHEDTEEINALLYSDDDSGDYISDEDDVTSTGHTPSTVLELCGKRERFDESKEESNPYKRQKLLSGTDAANLSLGLELSKKEKIRETLKRMEGIVPGVKGKDPIVILDGAIEYLKAMKLRAQVIGKNLY